MNEIETSRSGFLRSAVRWALLGGLAAFGLSALRGAPGASACTLSLPCRQCDAYARCPIRPAKKTQP